jgi:hypothetical protein
MVNPLLVQALDVGEQESFKLFISFTLLSAVKKGCLKTFRAFVALNIL